MRSCTGSGSTPGGRSIRPRRGCWPKPDYPPLLENYLASTLARRLNLRLPEPKKTESAYTRLEHEAGAMLETESILTALEQDRILGMTNLGLPADQPLPEPVDPPPLAVPEPDAKVKVEPIALHVPAECFYVRFGSYSQFPLAAGHAGSLGAATCKTWWPSGAWTTAATSACRTSSSCGRPSFRGCWATR